MKLGNTLFLLPNLLTAASLFCGTYAIMKCVGSDVTNEDVYRSSILLFYAFIFDLFDGRVARMTKTQSTFGIEFDSLADLVSFGVAPAVIAYRWSLEAAGPVGAIIAFFYVLAGAVRLARFNVVSHSATKKKDPGKYMMGLPIPMAAAFIVSSVVATRAMKDGEWPWLTSHGLTIRGMHYPMICVFMLGLAFLMVSTVRFRSFKDFKVRNTFSVFIMVSALVVSLVCWIFFEPEYILIGLLLMYLAIGFVESIYSITPKRRKVGGP